MAQLIVNADDLGLTEGINAGILEGHTRGIVTSASLMVDAPATEDAVRAVRGHPHLSIGLHFVEDRPEILEDPPALANALAAQLERFRSLTGRDPTHIDSHHHVHMPRRSQFLPLAEALGVPLRGGGRVRYLGDFYAEHEDRSRVGREHLLRLLRPHAQDGPVELGCHPGRVTPELSSSYREAREVELQTLTSPGLDDELGRMGFDLTSFAGFST